MENENLIEKIPEDITSDGQPIWMAFLNDPEALTISATETQNAKNAVSVASPEVIDNCRRLPLKDCINEVQTKIAA